MPVSEPDGEGLVPLQDDRDRMLHFLIGHFLAVHLEHAGAALADAADVFERQCAHSEAAQKESFCRVTHHVCPLPYPQLVGKAGARKSKSLVSSQSALAQSPQGSAGPQIDHKSWWSTDSCVRRSAARSRLSRPNSCIR